MQLDDVIYSCERIAGISGFPLRVYDGGTCAKECFPQAFEVDPLKPFEPQILAKQGKVSYLITPFHQFYGSVRHESFTIVLGPIGYEKYTLQQQHDYAFALGISLQAFQKLYGMMFSIPPMPLESFLHLLLLLDFYFNGEKKQVKDIVPYLQDDMLENEIPLANTEHAAVSSAKSGLQEPSTVHNALEYERCMLSYVRGGDEEGLKKYVMNAIHGGVGVLSGDQLRQQKNLFIVSATVVSRAAVEGGMVEDEAMGISDRYIRHCEELFSPEAVLRLQYKMVMDYTHRVATLANSVPLSPLTASVITYIRQNITQPLDTQTLAEQFHVSRKTLHQRFTAEVGQSVADYVLLERIRRAKSLLTQTDRSLAEIADYLGFSSQSHFQTRFKAVTGQTPMQYRKDSQNIKTQP